MNLTTLLFELKQRDIQLKSLNRERLEVDAPREALTRELLFGLREHKDTLICYFAPCKHCGKKLSIAVFPTWFQVWCPSFPVHFWIEEHQESFGRTVELENVKAA